MGLVPFALFVQGLAPDRDGRLSAVRGSLVFGLVYFGILFYWILVALIWFTKMAVLAYLGALALLVGVAALFGWMLHRTVHELRAPMWLALPVTWTAVEWFRAHWPGPLAFPWLGLGSSLTGFPELVGMAELVGSRGVTFWIVLVNGLFATAMLGRGSGRRPWGLGVVLAAVLLLPPSWGVWRAHSLELREVGRVAVVQPNVPEHIKLDDTAALDSTFASLERLIPRIEPGSVMMVALPEVTVPIYARADYAVGAMARLQDHAREVGAPILFGGLGYTGDVYGEHVPFNSVFLMEPQGLTDYQYDKRYLVPMVERVPLVPDRWLRGLGYFGKFGAGKGWPLARVDEAAFGALVCYESTYPEASRRFRLEGGDALVNVTNDAWYGREPWYSRSSALWQHPAHMVMRAIENRMGVARAANTGISLFVDPVGRVYNPTRLFEADVRWEMVYTTDVLTLYTRFGDLVGNGSALAALILVLAASRLRRRFPSLDHTTPRH